MKSFNRVEEIDQICEECNLYEDLELIESEYQGKKVTLNKPSRSQDGKKKFYVYVKNEKGNVVKVGFGDPNMEIKEMILQGENLSEQDITATILALNGKLDIGVVINGVVGQK